MASRPPKRLYPRLRLDISFGDLLSAAGACAVARRGDREDRVRRAWRNPNGLVCLSVRSGFELLLDALELEAGDEIAYSAITHPDMVRIAAARGLVAVPIDLDPGALAPEPEALERVLGPRTRVAVVAHLFGGSVERSSWSRTARSRSAGRTTAATRMPVARSSASARSRPRRRSAGLCLGFAPDEAVVNG